MLKIKKNGGTLMIVERKKLLGLSWCLLFLGIVGCSLKDIKKQTTAADNLGYIQGTVERTSSQKGNVIVLRFRDEDGVPVLETRLAAPESGEFQFSVPPGNFYVAAYIDTNNDLKYQPGEHGNFHGLPTTVEVVPNKTVSLPPLVISGEVPKPDAEIKPIEKVRAAWRNIGQVVSFDDPRFTRDYYNMGLWRPFDFLEKAEGGLFFLEEYQENKVPVLFIHGVLDGPSLWKEVVANLDRRTFQPWFAYYPSGARLDNISGYLVQAVTRLQNKHGFEKYYVVAHSMGGLVTRSFVKKYVEHHPDNIKRLQLVITINSPMDGMSSAASGVKHSPIVVPSWRDVEPGSEFLQVLHAWQWPGEIPYHLVISYLDGRSDDGVVSLQSQSSLKLQAEASRIYVFNNEHSGTLRDTNFFPIFNKILADRSNE